ncbi:MAG: phosphate signaling complex protein PhoU [Methylococcaceae bacterium]
MEKNNIRHHISRQFNDELEGIRNKVLAMGGYVEQQMEHAVDALIKGDVELAEKVIKQDHKANMMEKELDEECTLIIARRQPTAFDLRLLISVLKVITDLERIGDQAERIARMAVQIHTNASDAPKFYEIQHLADKTKLVLHGALDAFARMDTDAVASLTEHESELDRENRNIIRLLVTHMMEDPRYIKRTLNVLWATRALERIGDHAYNICEYVVFMVKGEDVRHIPKEELDKKIT